MPGSKAYLDGPYGTFTIDRHMAHGYVFVVGGVWVNIFMKIGLFLQTFIDFVRDDCMMLAAAISCFFVLAFIPFVLFLVSIFGYFLGSHREFHDLVLGQLLGFFPNIVGEVTDELGSIIVYREIGVIMYALFSYQLYVAGRQ